MAYNRDKQRTPHPVTTGRPESRTVKSERPKRGSSRAGGRPQRNASSISEFRDILGVLNKDPAKRYRWVLSTYDMDKRIFDARRAGWEFVDATQESNLIPGDYAVGKSTADGSFYRIPAGRRVKDEYLYLMWMPEEFAQEVDDWKQAKIDDNERELFRERRPGDDLDKSQYTKEGEMDIWEEDRVAPQSD